MLAGILAHLRDVLPVPDTPDVAIAEDIDILTDMCGRVESGSVVIMPFREQADPSPLASGGFRQRVAVHFVTAIVIRTFDDLLGAERALQFDGHRRRLEQALAGWEPPGATSPCQLVGGESSAITTGVSVFTQTWETARFLTGHRP
ncbi:hypothetical protein ACEYYA_02565 [Paracoccus sp. p3-h83]|uniref:phage tail terminator protein n=1 Tax=Paracoccus sp. p3-h83 TaxID=3342805 RepID=UPI0035BB974B